MMNGTAATGGARFVAATGGARFVAAAAAAKPLDDELSLPILLAERVRKAALEADSFKSDCAELANQVHLLADTLRSVARLSPSYDRPIRRVFASASNSLHPALAFARRCRRPSLLRRILSLLDASLTDHRKIHSLLDASLADLRWLLSLYSDNNILSLPPIASTDPILSLIWSYIATVHMSTSPADRAEAAALLANLALDNDRNKNFIVDEGGLPPLLSLVKDDSSTSTSTEARISAAVALTNIAAVTKNVKLMIKETAVPVIIAVLYDAPMRLQTRVALLVSRMAERDPDSQEEFARENACRPLVSLLSIEVALDEPQAAAPRSVHSLVRGIVSASASPPPSSRSYWERSHHRRDNENETPEAKLELKNACSEALWVLTRGCVSNSRKITETTKGLLCLAKIIERERGPLQYNCLMTIMEIASAAEMDADLRCTAFKTKTPAAMAVVDQLLRLVQLGSSSSLALQIAAVKAIGSLSRIFSKDTHVLSPLAGQLGHWNPDVAVEAANALSKFASPDNFNCAEHSKGIVESGAVPQLLRLLRTGEKTQLPALTLLCHLALHAPNSEALGRYRVLGTLESVARTAVAHHPSLNELLLDAIYHLELYRGGGNPHVQLYTHGSLPL